MGIGKISVFQESDVFGFFLGGDFERFPRDCIETIDEMASDSEKNVAMVLIKVLPNTFE